ncbi:MAG: DUF1192 domain-containing protein [Rhodospirillaceae bacterium]|nr:DUF1192 domain-containing protein [Rhodospirillaceae bacterium]|tara:strand:+ start:393 stop:581 length:189 start_codon:yes stop_codon:yes gene_type:complete
MDEDDLQPQHQKKKPPPKNLEEMSIGALEEYIAELEAEIVRVGQTIAGKQDARAGAERFFKK